MQAITTYYFTNDITFDYQSTVQKAMKTAIDTTETKTSAIFG